MMLTAIRVELVKIYSKWRTYIGYIALGFIIPVVIVAMQLEGMAYFEFATQYLLQNFYFTGNLMSGYTVTYIILGALYVHVPLLVTLVAGDILAGEATAGTYRVLLTRPLSRTKILVAKFVATSVSTVMLVLFLAVLSLGLGLAVLGSGDVIILANSMTVLRESDAMWRFIMAFLFSMLSMLTVSTLAFMFSSFVENAIGPIMTTMAIIIVLTILSALHIPFFDAIRPYFFTMKMDDWKLFFEDPVDWARVGKSTTILLTHIVFFFSVSVYIMNKKDILS